MRKGDLANLKGNAARYGITIFISSPGDGVSRYQFYREGKQLFTALGFGNAREMWNAYIAGVRDGEDGSVNDRMGA